MLVTAEELEQIGVRIVFAATEVDDPTKLHTIIAFKSVEAFQEFKSRSDILEKRKNSGVLIETSMAVKLSEPRIDIW